MDFHVSNFFSAYIYYLIKQKQLVLNLDLIVCQRVSGHDMIIVTGIYLSILKTSAVDI